MRSTEAVRKVQVIEQRYPNSDKAWGKTRYRGGRGRNVTRFERPTYDRAHRAMLRGLIESWHIYEDGWTFTVDGVETKAVSLQGAEAVLNRLFLAAT